MTTRTSHRATPAAHATTTSPTSSFTPQRVALCAVFVALAFVASFIEIPLFPAAAWLKYDPSGIVCAVAGLVFGPVTGVIVSLLPWVLRLFINPWGALMAALATVALTLPAALMYQLHHTRKGAAAGLALGAVCCLGVVIVANLVITPLYSGMDIAQVAELIVPVLLPFNLIKLALNAGITFALYRTVERMVAR